MFDLNNFQIELIEKEKEKQFEYNFIKTIVYFPKKHLWKLKQLNYIKIVNLFREFKQKCK